MASSKLNYANIRSAQRKNKSMHEAKDLLPRNLHPSSLYNHNLSPPYPLDQPTKLSRDPSAKGQVTYSLFEDPQSGDKLNYAKKLFGRYNEEPVKQPEEKVTRGHHRVKSSITEMYHKGPEILQEEERMPSGHTFGRFETTKNYNTLHIHESTGSGGIAARLEEDYRLMKEKSKENNRQREERGYGTSGQSNKEGRMLGDFLRRDGGFGKETASPDEMRPRKKELTLAQEQPEESMDKKSGVKLFAERSPRNISIEDNLSPKTGDFVMKLDNYIDYFKKSERSHRRGSKGVNEYFGAEERGKSREEGNRDSEIKIVKKQVEGLNTKMNEVMKANKKILKEFGHMLTREDEYRHRLGGLEEEFAALRKRNKKYREKLKITTHMLEKERVEHENNIIALNKILSSGVNMTLEQKIRKYVDHQREKSAKYDNGIGDSHHKRHEEKLEKSEWKERNRSSGKRHSATKDDSLYAQKVSIFSDDGNYLGKKTGRRDMEEDDDGTEDDNEDKLNTIEQEQEDDLYSSTPDNQDMQQHQKNNLWSPSRQKKTVESSKEYQIRVLQEKLAELMEERERSKHGHHDKNSSQVWPRTIESTLMSAAKQSKSKSRNNAKHSGGVNTENFGYTRERQGSHHKGNSFYSREESAFE